MRFLLRGLYTAASGMLLCDQQSNSIRENIENLHHPGYRQESEQVTSFPRLLVNRLDTRSSLDGSLEKVPLGIMGTGVYAARKYYSSKPGQLRETGVKTDLALNSEGYFVVETLQGERYTRNGHFVLDPAGMLRTAGGNMVLGENGMIGPLPEDFIVDMDGTIRDKDNHQILGKIRIVNIPAEALQKDGLTELFISTVEPQEALPEEVRIHQGYVEESNVELVSQMVKTLQVSKAYAANQKVIQTNDNLLQKTVNEIGRV
ncbi:MAG TPA: flagellar hook-basal body protein [Peptococcaceae bacterium]|nr:flagellar hook-basal body protein [Peptococcaceae bacterium]